MRVNPIYTYNRFNSAQKNKQVSFGLIENEENTKRVLPKNSDYRIPFNTQWEYLKKHDAVTVTSEGDKAWARINHGFEDMYGRLAGKSLFMAENCLTDLEKQRRFDSFYYRLESVDYDRKNPNAPTHYCRRDTRSQYEIDIENGFGYKVD